MDVVMDGGGKVDDGAEERPLKLYVVMGGAGPHHEVPLTCAQMWV